MNRQTLRQHGITDPHDVAVLSPPTLIARMVGDLLADGFVPAASTERTAVAEMDIDGHTLVWQETSAPTYDLNHCRLRLSGSNAKHPYDLQLTLGVRLALPEPPAGPLVWLTLRVTHGALTSGRTDAVGTTDIWEGYRGSVLRLHYRSMAALRQIAERELSGDETDPNNEP